MGWTGHPEQDSSRFLVIFPTIEGKPNFSFLEYIYYLRDGAI
jgi:hypothetical protein